MIDPRLPQTLREELLRLAVDWGNAYAGPGAGGAVQAYPAEVADAAGASPLPVLAEATVTSVLEPMRRLPSHQSEQISQVRTGEWLALLLEEGEWWLVSGEDGYVGWVRSWVLRRQDEGERAAQLKRRLGRYARPHDTLWASDHWAGSPLWRGIPLLTLEERPRRRPGEILVELPHGPAGWLVETLVEAPPGEASLTGALDTARSLLGTPYQWGGRSPCGLDCSGYVQMVFQMAGFGLARDARQQVLAGDGVPADPDAWQAGDLLFFGDPPDHVGLYDGRGGLLHCSAWARWQKLGDIPQLMGRLSHVRRLGRREWISRATLWQSPVRDPDAAS